RSGTQGIMGEHASQTHLFSKGCIHCQNLGIGGPTHSHPLGTVHQKGGELPSPARKGGVHPHGIDHVLGVLGILLGGTHHPQQQKKDHDPLVPPEFVPLVSHIRSSVYIEPV